VCVGVSFLCDYGVTEIEREGKNISAFVREKVEETDRQVKKKRIGKER